MRSRSHVRRNVLALTVGLAVVTAACGDDGDGGGEAAATTVADDRSARDAPGTTSNDATGEGWSYTDALGNTAELDAPPERIAGLTDAVAGLWGFGIEPVAAFGYQSMSEDVQFDEFDTSGVVEVGANYGEINLEALRAADPDLIVTTVYSEDPDELLYGFEDESQLARVEEIAPVVAITMVGDGEDVIEQVADLAEAIGADLESPELAQAKADFAAAQDRLAAAGERDISILPLAAYADEIFLAEAEDDPALHMYKQAGADFIDLDTEEFFWEQISWERIDKYDADIVLYSLRAMDPEEMKDQPTFKALPAAQAGQVHEWKYVGMNYASQAAYMNELAGWIESAEPVATG